MKHLKNLILIVATAIILVLIATTIIESSKGTPFVRQNIYSSLWFVLLWAALAVAATCYIVLRKLHRTPIVFLIHASLEPLPHGTCQKAATSICAMANQQT